MSARTACHTPCGLPGKACARLRHRKRSRRRAHQNRVLGPPVTRLAWLTVCRRASRAPGSAVATGCAVLRGELAEQKSERPSVRVRRRIQRSPATPGRPGKNNDAAAQRIERCTPAAPAGGKWARAPIQHNIALRKVRPFARQARSVGEPQPYRVRVTECYVGAPGRCCARSRKRHCAQKSKASALVRGRTSANKNNDARPPTLLGCTSLLPRVRGCSRCLPMECSAVLAVSRAS